MIDVINVINDRDSFIDLTSLALLPRFEIDRGIKTLKFISEFLINSLIIKDFYIHHNGQCKNIKILDILDIKVDQYINDNLYRLPMYLYTIKCKKIYIDK